jgi:hypothetical protein
MKSLQFSLPKSLNLLIYSLPATFILGNFFINLLIFFVSILGIVYYKDELFSFKKNNPLILIILFFVLIVFSTSVETFKNTESEYLLKSVLFFRYLIFVLILRCMILKGDLNLQRTLFSCLLFSSFVAADVIFQYFIGVDILGNKRLSGFASGLFGEEAIAGGYIQKFAIIGFFSSTWLSNKKGSKFFSISFSLLIICFLGTLLSGNRMPTLMFAFFFFLLALFFLLKKFNIQTTAFVFLVLLSFVLIVSGSEKIKSRYYSFYVGIPKPSQITAELKKEYLEFKKYENTGIKFWHTEVFKKNEDNIKLLAPYTGHTQIYITAIDTFLDNPLMGRGIKSFRHTCLQKMHLPNRMCENHSHHFYLEILNDTGIIGFVVIFAAIILLIIKNFNKYYKKNTKVNEIFNLTFYAVFFSLIIEFFPLRSQGSLFSVWNAAYIFFILGIFCGLYDLKPKKFFKNRLNF